jgi:hypothetical protein
MNINNEETNTNKYYVKNLNFQVNYNKLLFQIKEIMTNIVGI